MDYQHQEEQIWLNLGELLEDNSSEMRKCLFQLQYEYLIHLASAELVSSDELMSDGDPSNIEMINLLISRNAQEQEERLKEIKESPLYSCMQQTPTLTITSQVGRWRIYPGLVIFPIVVWANV